MTILAVREAAEAARDRRTHAELGRLTDHAHTTWMRRAGLEALALPAIDLLQLARADADLAQAITAFLAGSQQPVGNPASLSQDLIAEVETSAGVSCSIRAALADNGKIDEVERASIIDAIERRHAADTQLLRDLRAAGRKRQP